MQKSSKLINNIIKKVAIQYLNNLKLFKGVYGEVAINNGIINVPAMRKVLKDGKPIEVEK